MVQIVGQVASAVRATAGGQQSGMSQTGSENHTGRKTAAKKANLRSEGELLEGRHLPLVPFMRCERKPSNSRSKGGKKGCCDVDVGMPILMREEKKGPVPPPVFV